MSASRPAPKSVQRVRLTSTPLAPRKASDLVAARLRRQIVTGVLTEGDVLPQESELMAVYGVSRATLREALRVLESEGLILVRRGAHGGARVLRPQRSVASRYAGIVLQASGTTLADIYRAQMIIEPPAIGELAARITPEQVARLRELCAEAEAVVDRDVPTSIAWFKRFHTEVVDMSGLQTIALFSSMLEHILEHAALPVLETLGEPAALAGLEYSNEAHRRLVDLLEAGDSSGAARHWHDHLAQTAELSPVASKVVDLLSPDD